MRVQKIIQSHSSIFNSDPNKTYTESEAILIIASTPPKGSKIQVEETTIRQRHLAICNLLVLGFEEEAVAMAKDLLPQAVSIHLYTIAQELCSQLLQYFSKSQNEVLFDRYQTLYKKYTLAIALEQKSTHLLNQASILYSSNTSSQLQETTKLLASLETKLAVDYSFYHFHYYHIKSMTLWGESLEQLLLQAISYFQGLYYNHSSSSQRFILHIIDYYLEINALEKTESYIRALQKGSLMWHKKYLLLVEVFLEQNDIKSNDICIKTMNHPSYIHLPANLKDQWKAIYKRTVRLLLDFS
ncbi:MAG: hypothetical protein P1U56_13605 [Saprospiraceae bacterium]|nr:hypothetical protein [Saprospiraceae bacterium]